MKRKQGTRREALLDQKMTRRGAFAATLAALAGVSGALVAAPPADAAPSFITTGNLITGTSNPVTVALNNGEVLFAGGTASSGAPVANAELYQQGSGTWVTTGSMPIAVTDASATMLSNGEVLVAGGLTGAAGALAPTAAAELYNPATGSWSVTGSLPTASDQAQMVLLKSGQAMYAGGMTGSGTAAATTNAVELYNPTGGGWTATGYLPVGVADGQVALLSNGDVLLAGGQTKASGAAANVVSSSERYQVSTNSWATVGSMPYGVSDTSAVTLPNGNVLIAGGETDASGTPTSTSEQFDPATNAWSPTGFLPFASHGAVMVGLGAGGVLYAGGMTTTAGNPTNLTALYNLTSNQWASTNAMLSPRADAGAAVLPDGDVLVAGGEGTAGVLVQSELYPASAAPAITSAASVNASVNTPLNFTVTTSGTPAPSLTESGNLPPGVSFHDNGNGTATISGTPVAGSSGTYALTITAQNTVSSTSQKFSIVFSAAPAITSASSASLTPGAAFNFTVTTSGTPTPKLTESGNLPPGVSFHDNGNGTATISGTPTASAQEAYSVTISASNGVGNAATQTLKLTLAVAPRITTGNRLTVRDGRSVRFVVRTSGNPTPTINATGRLPRGLGLYVNQNGTATLSGTPAAGQKGVFRLVITASNGVGTAARQVFTLIVINPVPPARPVPSSPRGVGYWYATAAGQVLFKGAARPIAARTPQHPADIVAMGVVPGQKGYYLVSSYGGVFGYGTAQWYGSATHFHFHTTVVGFAVTPDGHGYYIVTRAGNVLTYGDAHFLGSTAGRGLPPIASFGLLPNGTGYYLVTIHGNIYTYGTAAFYGSPARQRIPTVTSFAVTPDGHGYWVATTAGNILSYGDARFYGSLAGRAPAPVISIASTGDGNGYWLVTSAGNIYGFGDARWFGSSAGTNLGSGVAAFAPMF
ncbi:MAG: putative Ig domain-containing protein [Actinomycetota bacterium]|nr:putative Ig domain-containing protein [Actinomycetota bacterium]